MSGVIYKIVTGNDVYVGSTIDYKMRMWRHKHNLKCGSKCRLYETIRANNGEWDMTIYKDNLSMTRDELCKYEDEVMSLLGATLNERKAYRTKEQLTESYAKSRKKNKVAIQKRKAVPMECECGCFIRTNDIARHRKSAKHARLMT